MRNHARACPARSKKQTSYSKDKRICGSTVLGRVLCYTNVNQLISWGTLTHQAPTDRDIIRRDE